MKTPNDDPLSTDEMQLARALEEEMEQHVRDVANIPYTFEPNSVGAAHVNERVKKEVIRRARVAGWDASDLDTRGGFTVSKSNRVSKSRDASALAVTIAAILFGAIGGWHACYAVTRYPTDNTDGDWAKVGAWFIGAPAGIFVGVVVAVFVCRARKRVSSGGSDLHHRHGHD